MLVNVFISKVINEKILFQLNESIQADRQKPCLKIVVSITRQNPETPPISLIQLFQGRVLQRNLSVVVCGLMGLNVVFSVTPPY